MAATFVNLDSGKAVRVTAREEARALSESYCPAITDKYQRQLEAYKAMSSGSTLASAAGVVKLADTQDLGSCAFGREGSSPFSGTVKLEPYHGCQ